MESKNRINSLQALRALAFIGIFMVHAKIAWGWSRLGVSIFFAMSGFLMTYIYWDREVPNNIISAIKFSISKIKKLYFLHIITMVAVVMIDVWIYINRGILMDSIRMMIKNIVLNIFLLQSWYPDSTVNVALNGVAWYLSVALFLYIIFPFILRWMKDKKIIVLVLAAVMLLVLQVALAYPVAARFGGDSVRYRWFMYCFPVYRIGDFFAGCVLGRIYMVSKDTPYINNTIAYTIIEAGLLAFSMWFSLWLGQPTDAPFTLAIKNWSTGYIIMALAWIYVFTRPRGLLTKLFANPVMIKLGDLSPQAFLIHYVLVRFVNAYMGLHMIPFTPLLTWILFAIEFIGTIIICLIYSKVKERRG